MISESSITRLSMPSWVSHFLICDTFYASVSIFGLCVIPLLWGVCRSTYIPAWDSVVLNGFERFGNNLDCGQ